jgi:hypothetical protein
MVWLRFIGEGREDVGIVLGNGKNERRCGCLVPFVENILRARSGRSVHFRHDSSLLPRLNLRAGRPRRGYKEKVKAALVAANEDRRHGVVIVVDEPSSREGSRLSRLRDGRSAAREAGVLLPCALGVAIPEIESWLLADDGARANNLGAAGRRPLRQPEEIDDPKALFSSLYGEYEKECEESGTHVREQWEVKESCAVDSRVDVVEFQCPRGFAPFADEVRTEIGNGLFPRKASR